MNISGFKVKGRVILEWYSRRCQRHLFVNRVIEVVGTPAGLMLGKFKHYRRTRYAIKAEGDNFTDWYEVGNEFPCIEKSKEEA